MGVAAHLPMHPQRYPAAACESKKTTGQGEKNRGAGRRKQVSSRYEMCVTTTDDKHEIGRARVHTRERQIY